MSAIDKIKRLIDYQSFKELVKITKGYSRQITGFVVMNTVYALLNIYIAVLTKDLIDVAVEGSYRESINLAIVLAIVFIFQLILYSIIVYRTTKYAELMAYDLRIKLLGTIYKKKWLEINQFKSGDLLTRLYSDIDCVVSVSIDVIPDIIAYFIQLVVAFCVLVYYGPLLALLAFLLAPISLIISYFIGSLRKVLQKSIQETNSKQRSLINESLQNILILKTYNYLDENINEVKANQKEKYHYVMKKNKLGIKANIAVSLGYRAGFFSAIVLGAYRLFTRAISFGTFTAFIQLVGQIQGPAHEIMSQIPGIIESYSSIERINEIVGLSDDEEMVSDGCRDFDRLELRDVSFGYDEKNVIEDLDLCINKGEKIAILGPSGVGKTTLIYLIMSILKQDKGSLMVIGEDNGEVSLSASTRGLFGYVPQRNNLFSGSIRDNLLLLEAVEEAEIRRAMETACIWEFIEALPDGLDTYLQEHGIGLSEGQAQRICIARALLHGAPVIVFDEATSALDLETEQQLVGNLKDDYPEVTLIAVTHRENILEICDRVVELGVAGEG